MLLAPVAPWLPAPTLGHAALLRCALHPRSPQHVAASTPHYARPSSHGRRSSAGRLASCMRPAVVALLRCPHRTLGHATLLRCALHLRGPHTAREPAVCSPSPSLRCVHRLLQPPLAGAKPSRPSQGCPPPFARAAAFSSPCCSRPASRMLARTRRQKVVW